MLYFIVNSNNKNTMNNSICITSNNFGNMLVTTISNVSFVEKEGDPPFDYNLNVIL